jgi:hypothetical protein
LTDPSQPERQVNLLLSQYRRRTSLCGLYAAVFAVCSVAATAQLQSPTTAASSPSQSSFDSSSQSGDTALPDAPAKPGFARGDGIGTPTHAPRHNPQGGFHNNTTKTFDWSRFLTGVSQTGLHFAVPQLSSQGGQRFGYESSAGVFTPGTGTSFGTTGSTSTGGSAGARAFGGTSMFDLGNNLLRDLASSSGGSLGASLNFLSGATNYRTGIALPTKSGLDLRLSGSLGDVMGTSFSRLSGEGGFGTGGGSGFSSGGIGADGMSGGAGGMNASGMGGGAHGQGKGGGGSGPGLSLKLKF